MNVLSLFDGISCGRVALERTNIEVNWYRNYSHTCTLCVIPSGVLNRLDIFTSRNPSNNSERMDKIYLVHANSLRKAGLATSNLPTLGDLWSKQDEKVDTEKRTRRQ